MATVKYDQVRNTRLHYTADRIRQALQQLPNFAIPSVNVTNYYIRRDDNGNGVYTDGGDVSVMFSNVFDVTFTNAANAGKQNLLECVYEHSNACEGAFPRLMNSGTKAGGTFAYNTARADRRECDKATGASDVGTQVCNYQYGNKDVGNVNVRSCTVEEVHPGTRVYEESVECSNRGTCDTGSGTCTCFEGHSGEACEEQTVFF